MPEVVVAGHVCVDLFPSLAGPPSVLPGVLSEVGALRMAPGGCVAGTGLALAELGVDTRLAAHIGEDELGDVLRRSLAARGLETAWLKPVQNASTSYSLVLEPTGVDRSFWHHVGANDAFDGHDLDLRGARLLHLGYPSLLPALCADDGAAWRLLLQRCEALDVTTSLDLATLDPASDAAGWDWNQLLRRVLPLTGVITPSAEDIAGALGVPTPANRTEARSIALQLLELGVGVVMLTCGADGLVVATADQARLERAGAALRPVAASWAGQVLWVPSCEVEQVTTTGAGDAASAGLLAALIAGDDAHAAAVAAAQTAAARVTGRDLRRRSEVVLRQAVPSLGWELQSSGVLRHCTTSPVIQ